MSPLTKNTKDPRESLATTMRVFRKMRPWMRGTYSKRWLVMVSKKCLVTSGPWQAVSGKCKPTCRHNLREAELAIPCASNWIARFGFA